VQALDRVLVEAGRHGVRLILSLANNLEAYGGKTQYVRWAWEEGVGLSASNDSFFFDPAIRDYFKVYLKVSSPSLSLSLSAGLLPNNPIELPYSLVYCGGHCSSVGWLANCFTSHHG
jgi:hypothetical protein